MGITEPKNIGEVTLKGNIFNEAGRLPLIGDDGKIPASVLPPGGGGATLADGDYGDIVVSGGGTIMLIDSGVITNTKIASNAAISWSKINKTGATTADIAASTDKNYVTDSQLTAIGTISTKADLVDGLVPASQLPSYVDDVLEYANYATLPGTGETGKIYVTLDTNLTYRWSGSAYVEISASLALGETSATAYRGDRGKTAYDHSQTTHDKAFVGLGNVDNVQQMPLSYLDTDGTMAANSDTKVPSQKAVVTYVAAHAGGSGTWGSITGTLTDQTDLQTQLAWIF